MRKLRSPKDRGAEKGVRGVFDPHRRALRTTERQPQAINQAAGAKISLGVAAQSRLNFSRPTQERPKGVARRPELCAGRLLVAPSSKRTLEGTLLCYDGTTPVASKLRL